MRTWKNMAEKMSSNPMKKEAGLKKVYMVSIPENADYAEWWYITGLFSTRKAAERFIREHPIRRYEQRNGSMKPRTKYDDIQEIEIDRAPLLEKWNRRDYLGKDKYLTKKEKREHQRWDERQARRTPLDELMERLDAHISVNTTNASEDIEVLRSFREQIKELFDNGRKRKKAGK